MRGQITIDPLSAISHHMSELIAQFETALSNLNGKRCFNVQAGAIGSLASLHFGEKIPLENPLPYPNPSLTPDEHKFRGEYVLYIEDCPWRIEDDEKVLATWLDSNAPTGPIVVQMNNLIGKTITSTVLHQPGMDLTIVFDHNITVRIFPDQVEPDEGDNYSLVDATSTFVVAAHSRLYKE